MIVDHTDGIGRQGGPSFEEADRIGRGLTQRFEAGEFDTCTVVYNRFKTVMSQVVTFQQLIPFSPPTPDEAEAEAGRRFRAQAIYDFEPDEEMILSDLLPRNLSIQIFRSLLENAASEQGARMTAMDSATRNAGEMIDKLTLHYNRTRQAQITKELIEIISGAEAL